MQAKIIDAPIVEASIIAKDKMDAIVDLVDKEISWLGLVSRVSNRHYLIEDVFLVDQESGPATTEITPSGWSDLEATLIDKNVMSDDDLEIRGLYCWGHSHYTMGVTPSGTDEKQLRDFLKGKPPFMIRIIANRRRDYRVDVLMCDHGILVEDVGLTCHSYSDELFAELQSEAEVLVRPVAPRPPITYMSTVPAQGSFGSRKQPDTPSLFSREGMEISRAAMESVYEDWAGTHNIATVRKSDWRDDVGFKDDPFDTPIGTVRRSRK